MHLFRTGIPTDVRCFTISGTATVYWKSKIITRTIFSNELRDDSSYSASCLNWHFVTELQQ